MFSETPILVDLVTGNRINNPRVRAETRESVGKLNGFSSKVSLSVAKCAHISTQFHKYTLLSLFHLHPDN